MNSVSFFIGLLGLIFLTQESGGVILGSLLMALKGGMFASKMGIGGLLAMMLAASHNQQNGGFDSDSSFVRKRATRSIPEIQHPPNKLNLSEIARVVVSDDSLVTNRTEVMEPERKSSEQLAAALNNAGLPATKRIMRQVAILDQLSCLPKVICGMNAKTPSSNTNILNDYGFLLKYLFQNDDETDDDAKQDDQDDDDEPDDDEVEYEDDGEALRSDVGNKKEEADTKNRKAPTKGEDEESSEDGEIDQMAQEELVDDEPEMMRYVLAEMKDKMNKYKHGHGGIHKGVHKSNYPIGSPDHSHLPGYDEDSYPYASHKNPALNLDSSQAILNEYPSSILGHKKGSGLLFGNKNIQLKLGSADDTSGSLLGALLPSFMYKKVKGPTAHDPGDPFANDPFFADFRRRDLKLQRSLKGDVEEDDSAEEKMESPGQTSERGNSRFKDIAYMTEKKEELQNNPDPLTKYKVAADVGQKTKSSRQCRILFAKCPYEFNEIMTMIDNVKKVVTADTKGVQSDTPGVSTISTGGGVVNVQSGGSGKPGVTQISHQLDNGDKVDIMVKIKSKDEGKLSSSPYQVFPKKDQYQSPELISADKSLTEMKKALHALVKLHNQTESKLLSLQKQKGGTNLAPYRIRSKINGINGGHPSSVSSTNLPQLQEKVMQEDDEQEHADPNTSNSSSKEKSSEETKGPSKLKKVTDEKTKAGGDNKDTKKKPSPSSQSKEEEDDTSDEEDQEEDEEFEDDGKAGPGVPYGFPSSGYRPDGPNQHALHFYRKQPVSSNFYMDFPHKLQPNSHSRPRPSLPPSGEVHHHHHHLEKVEGKPKRKNQRRPQQKNKKAKKPKQPASTVAPSKKPETENPLIKGREPSPLPPKPSSYKIIRPPARYRPRTGLKIIPEIAAASDVKSDEDER